MTDEAIPCPICGNAPEIDTGLQDAPFEYPLISCPTIHMKGDITSRCPMHADGIAAWNYICEVAEQRRHAPAPVTLQEAARVLLEAEATEDRRKIYAACENRVKVYKFFTVLRALAGQGVG